VSNDLFTRDNFQVTSGQRFVTGGKEYTLGGSVGAGAIGIVRRAVELRSRIQVAVKFLAPEPKYIEESSFEDMRARFRREGMRGEGLSHNHLVKIIAYEENKDGSCFEDTIPTTVKLGDFGIVKWGDFKASITTGSLTIAGQQGLRSLEEKLLKLLVVK